MLFEIFINIWLTYLYDTMKRKISRCMSTQHPDNVSTPFFSESEILYGNAEITEAYYVFSHLGCEEQMWDNEGKEIDNQVVEKLLTKYPDFFSEHTLGKDIFLTYRSPNPTVQKNKGKVLLELLHSIPRTYDAAKSAGSNVPPIFEVILPMTTKAIELERMKSYYTKIIVGQNKLNLIDGDISIGEWVGEIKPKNINIIPLYEDYNTLLNIGEITKEYIQFIRDKSKEELECQRVFLARSDPALNYGSVSAVLLAKIALSQLYEIQEEASVDIFPILGVGSAPFRGNLKPTNVQNCASEYPSVQTFSVQSAFKYDYPFEVVKNGITELKNTKTGRSLDVDKESALMLIDKIKVEYQKQLHALVDIINTISVHIPQRRKRQLHVGLFGYSRSTEQGVQLPRAIKFCASLYSLGIPPELLGLGQLNQNDWDLIRTMYVNIDEDISSSIQYVNSANLSKMPKVVSDGVEKVLEQFRYKIDENHAKATSEIYHDLIIGKTQHLKDKIEYAAWLRKFLG